MNERDGTSPEKRKQDRRQISATLPPPFLTGSGLVHVERRSVTDRRRNWVRNVDLDYPGCWSAGSDV